MNNFSQIVWITLLGVSLLFVGGFVLWVYGTQKASQGDKKTSPLVQWFFLYGAVTSFAGIGCLLTVAMMVM